MRETWGACGAVDSQDDSHRQPINRQARAGPTWVWALARLDTVRFASFLIRAARATRRMAPMPGRKIPSLNYEAILGQTELTK